MKSDTINIGRLVAQFVRTYGNSTFDNGRIGWKWFWLLTEEMNAVFAMERVHEFSAVSMGVSAVMGDGNNVKGLLKQSIEEANVIE